MLRRPSLLARTAAGVALLLAVVLIVNVVRADTDTGALLAGAAAAVTVACGVVLGMRPRFEAGLLLALTAAATATGATLAMTVGMPGPGGPVIGVVQVLLLLLSAAVLVLLLGAVRAQRLQR